MSSRISIEEKTDREILTRLLTHLYSSTNRDLKELVHFQASRWKLSDPYIKTKLLIVAVTDISFPALSIKSLLIRGANPFIRLGAYDSAADEINKLIEHGDCYRPYKVMDYIGPNCEYDTAFATAFKFQNIPACVEILNFSCNSSLKDLALYHACVFGFDKQVKILIENGAKVTVNNNRNLRTAVYLNNITLVSLLCKNGGNPLDCGLKWQGSFQYGSRIGGDLEDDSLAIACEKGFIEIAHILLSYGANPSAKNCKCLEYACKGGYYNLVRLLVQRGAVFNDNCLAIACNDQRMFDLVFSFGTTLNQRNNAIIKTRSSNFLQVLLESGVDQQAKDESLYFQCREYPPCHDNIKMLLDAGAKWPQKLSCGEAVRKIGKYSATLGPLLSFLLDAGAELETGIIASLCWYANVDYDYVYFILKNARDKISVEDLNEGLYLACTRDLNPKLINLLISHGADVSAIDFAGLKSYNRIIPFAVIKMFLENGLPAEYLVENLPENSVYGSCSCIDYFLELGVKNLDYKKISLEHFVKRCSSTTLRHFINLFPDAARVLAPYFSEEDIAKIKLCETPIASDIPTAIPELKQQTESPPLQQPLREQEMVLVTKPATVEIVTPTATHSFPASSLELKSLGVDFSLLIGEKFILRVSDEDEEIALLALSLVFGLVKLKDLPKEDKLKVCAFRAKQHLPLDTSLIFAAFDREPPATRKEALLFMLENRDELAALGLRDLSQLYHSA